jgi:hypothetical protein
LSSESGGVTLSQPEHKSPARDLRDSLAIILLNLERMMTAEPPIPETFQAGVKNSYQHANRAIEIADVIIVGEGGSLAALGTIELVRLFKDCVRELDERRSKQF